MDYDSAGQSVTFFRPICLAKAQNGTEPSKDAERFADLVNFGNLCSHVPDDDDQVGNLIGDRSDGDDTVGHNLGSEKSSHTLEAYRASLQNQGGVSITVGAEILYLLVSHPTSSSSTGLEVRNGRGYSNEIRFRADSLPAGGRAAYLGAAADSLPTTFVLLGGLKVDPSDARSVPRSIDQLLSHPKVASGVVFRNDDAAQSRRANGVRRGRPDHDTADFDDRSAENLNADSVVTSDVLSVVGSGIVWPVRTDPVSRLVRTTPVRTTAAFNLIS